MTSVRLAVESRETDINGSYHRRSCFHFLGYNNVFEWAEFSCTPWICWELIKQVSEKELLFAITV